MAGLTQVLEYIWEPEFRADGNCICGICGRSYYSHRPEPELLFDGYPFLTILCNGERVKL